MLGRALIIWCVLLVVAILNGALRVAWLIPRFGDTLGPLVSTVSPVRGHRPAGGLFDWLGCALETGGRRGSSARSGWDSRSRSSFSVVTFCSGVPRTRFRRLQPVAGSHLDRGVGSDGGRANRGGSNPSSVFSRRRR